MIKSILCATLVLFLARNVGRAQVVVNPDGSHSVVTGNVIVNPDGSHSVLAGNVIVNSNGTHSVIAGNVIVNSNGTHSVIIGNVLVNPDGSHSAIPAVLKSTDAIKRKSAPRNKHRESGNFEKRINKLYGKDRNGTPFIPPYGQLQNMRKTKKPSLTLIKDGFCTLVIPLGFVPSPKISV